MRQSSRGFVKQLTSNTKDNILILRQIAMDITMCRKTKSVKTAIKYNSMFHLVQE